MARFPVAEAFRQATWPILFTMLAFTIGTAGFYFTNTFLIAYTTRTLGLDRAVILDCLTIVAVVQFLGQLAAAKIAERIGDSEFLLAAAGLADTCAVSDVPARSIEDDDQHRCRGFDRDAMRLRFLCGHRRIREQGIPGGSRYSSMSASYQLGGAIFGGFTPMIGVALSASYPGQWVPLAIFYSILADSRSFWCAASRKGRLRHIDENRRRRD